MPVNVPHDWSCVFTSNVVMRASSVAISTVFVAIIASCAACDALLLTIYPVRVADVAVAKANAEYATGPSPAGPGSPCGP